MSYLNPYCDENGEWNYEIDGQVIGPFTNEEDAWKDMDARTEPEEERTAS